MSGPLVRPLPPVAAKERSVPNAGTASEIERTDDAQLQYELLRARLYTPAELELLPPPEPLIEGMLYRNTLATTYGRPGTAKSFIAMSMALSVVTGQPWFGRPVQQGSVLYIAGEGVSGLAQRQRAWREVAGWPQLDGMHWLPMGVNLLEANWLSALVRLVGELEPRLVVVDTVARSMPGADENSSADMGAFVAAADRIREASAATVNLVHHTPKEGSTPRGHSALEGAVDTALLLERNGSNITLSMVKQKDGPAVDPMVFELAPVGASVVPVLPRSTATSLELVGAERAVRDLVWQCAGSDGLSSTALLRMAEVPERSFYRAMKVLRDRQIIRNVGTERQPRWAASEDVLPSTAKDCHDTPAVLTATAPPLGGLAVGSTDGFHLDEELF